MLTTDIKTESCDEPLVLGNIYHVVAMGQTDW